MIRKIIHWSFENRFLVLLATFVLLGWGLYTLKNTPLDAIPDLSDVQVIIKTSFPGQAPQVVEDQVTYPLATTMLSVPGAKVVRGYSFFGASYLYVIFEDGTDLYWARSRVLEYLNQAASSLPKNARPALGPDATGVGWIYEYALVDKTGAHDLGQLTTLQDWFLKYELQTVPGVAEVATVGGMVKEFQVVVDPEKLRALKIPLPLVKMAIRKGNLDVGGSVVELAEGEYMVRSKGYLQGIQDLENIPLKVVDGVPVRIKDVAAVRLGPELRRGVAELDGQGEVVGGVVIMRFGENALRTIRLVKERLADLKRSLPAGVEIVPTYDRSTLIIKAVETLKEKLIEEFIVVALICVIFLFHLRSALVAIVSLPLGVLGAFLIMFYQGINANIMSLGGIAIAIGAMVDAAIVMIENAHKHLESSPDKPRLAVMQEAAGEVGPALFFSLLIITLSFVPIFTLQAQEGRLFSPLAFTKTYCMAVAAGLSITLVPVLMFYFIRGKVLPEHKNPINRFLIWAYRPVISTVLKYPKLTCFACLLLLLTIVYPARNIGSEFMPPLWEGDLLYMPTTLPGVSVGKARQILQQTDKIIATFPEVKRVFGKVGRAKTATDPAPLTMIETVIWLKPRSMWRPGMTVERLKQELDQACKLPGLTNAWTMPIKTRIDMLATGIKTPVGIKIAGPDLHTIQQLGEEMERVLRQIPGTASAYAERTAGGRYVSIDIDRLQASRYGLNVSDVQDVVMSAIGGMTVSETVVGRERYPINVRYPREFRDSLSELAQVRLTTPQGFQVPLTEVASIRIVDGPPAIKSENARLNGWIYVDIRGVDVGSYVQKAKQVIQEKVRIPSGYSLTWSGQYEYMLRAKERLLLVVPVTILIILLLLYLNFKRLTEVFIVMGTVPFALLGGYWLIYLMGYNLSVAIGVGFIALTGVAVEIGVVMLIYLEHSVQDYQENGRLSSRTDLMAAVRDGALLRVRPVMMTVCAIMAGLLPIMIGAGIGSQVMKRIAAPMLGGMVSTTLLTMILIPVVYFWVQAWRLRNNLN